MEKQAKKRQKSPITSALKGLGKTITAFFKGLSLIRKIAVVVIIGAFIGVIVFGGVWLFKSTHTETQYLSSSDLAKVIEVEELNTTELTYRGIVQKKDDKGKTAFNISYEAKVRAGIDLTKVTFEIDNEDKVVSPALPDIEVREPTVDADSLDYLPAGVDVNLNEIIKLCKSDASKAVANESDVEDLTRRNARSIIEALTSPLLKEEGYTLSWEHDDELIAKAQEKEANDAE